MGTKAMRSIACLVVAQVAENGFDCPATAYDDKMILVASAHVAFVGHRKDVNVNQGGKQRRRCFIRRF